MSHSHHKPSSSLWWLLLSAACAGSMYVYHSRRKQQQHDDARNDTAGEEVAPNREKLLQFVEAWRKHVHSSICRADLVALLSSIHSRLLHIHKYRCIVNQRYAPRIDVHPFTAFLLGQDNHHSHSTPAYHYQLLRQSPSLLRILDVGCCIGSDVRYLLLHGCSHVMGIDCLSEWFDVGRELYGDNLQQVTFGDILHFPLPMRVQEFTQIGVDVVHAGFLLHVFTEQQVVTALTNMMALLSKRGVLYGRCVGATQPCSVLNRMRHSASSLQALLSKIGYENVSVHEDEQPPITPKPDHFEGGRAKYAGQDVESMRVLVFFATKP